MNENAAIRENDDFLHKHSLLFSLLAHNQTNSLPHFGRAVVHYSGFLKSPLGCAPALASVLAEERLLHPATGLLPAVWLAAKH
jgi:hypothetical protein